MRPRCFGLCSREDCGEALLLRGEDESDRLSGHIGGISFLVDEESLRRLHTIIKTGVGWMALSHTRTGLELWEGLHSASNFDICNSSASMVRISQESSYSVGFKK
jgi:hypothetical protein